MYKQSNDDDNSILSPNRPSHNFTVYTEVLSMVRLMYIVIMNTVLCKTDNNGRVFFYLQKTVAIHS